VSRFLVNLVLFVAVLAVIAWWFRGYGPQLRRSFIRLRDTVRFFRRASATFRDLRQSGSRGGSTGGGAGGGFNPEDFMRGARPGSRAQEKVVDVPATQFKVVCPTCGDSLTEAQTNALRSRSLRCPGSSRVGRECPFYGRSLN
jgi:hypothetical protein